MCWPKHLTRIALPFLLIAGGVQAQDADYEVAWAVQAGGSRNDIAQAVSVDASGNLLVVGRFRGTAMFGATTLASAGQEDIFVAKYSPDGAPLWVVRAGGSDNDTAFGVAVDHSGNAYVAGRFTGTVVFGSTTLVSAGDFDGFLAKYGPDGTVLWAASHGGPGWDGSGEVAVDESGDAYVAGFFHDTATFGSTTLTSAGERDAFLAKYTADGALLWAKSAGGAGSDYASGVVVDPADNVLITGHFHGSASFDSTILTGEYDVYLARYGPDGTLLWVVAPATMTQSMWRSMLQATHTS